MPALTDQPIPHFPAEQDQGPKPSFLEIAAAAERQGNLGSALVDPLERSLGWLEPRAPSAAEPGYNFLDHIPPGYLHRYGSLYVNTGNAAQAEEVTRDIRQREADGATIARAGGPGFAAVMAAGLTDPVNAAAMAIVPEAAATRIGNAVRWSLVNAATTAAQEGLWHEVDPTRTVRGAGISVGAAAVLGGVLGPFAPRVPAGVRQTLTEDLAKELHAAEPPPVHTAAVDTSELEAMVANNASGESSASQEAVNRVAQEKAEGITRWQIDPDGNATPLRGVDAVDARAPKGHVIIQQDADGTATILDRGGLPQGHANGLVNRAKALGQIGSTEAEKAPLESVEASKVLGPESRRILEDGPMPEAPKPTMKPIYVEAPPEPPEKPRPGFTPGLDPGKMSLTEAIAVSKGSSAKGYGLSYDEAVRQGLDPADLEAARFGSRRVFTKGGASFDEMAELLHQHGYPVQDEAGHYSPNALLDALDSELRGKKQYSPAADDYLAAHAAAARAEEEAERAVSPYEAELERDARMVQSKETEHSLPGEPMFRDVWSEKIVSMAKAEVNRKIAEAEAEIERVGHPERLFKDEKPERTIAKAERDIKALRKEMAEFPEPGTPIFDAEPPEDLPEHPPYVNPELESTMGAAAVRGGTLEDLTTARGAQLYAKTVGKASPSARILNARSPLARQLVTELANIPGTLEGNYRGIATAQPVERELWRAVDGTQARSMTTWREAYKDYAARLQEKGETPIPRRDFGEQIAFAMRRGDKSTIPEVAKAAQWIRANVFNPLYERAMKLGMIPEEARLYAESYLTRLYDVSKINANYGQWIERLRRYFIGEGVDPAEATTIAYDATRNIRGAERGTLDWHVMDGIVAKSGRLKGRQLTMPDTKMEDFLSNDIDHLTHAYLRTLTPEVEMTERFGSRDLKDQLDAITDQYSHLTEQARAAGDNALMANLAKEEKWVRTDLQAIRDRLYGIYGAPKDPSSFAVRAGRMLRASNVPRMLGAATISHFPDLANVIARYGTANTFGAMAKLATSLDAVKLGYREAQRMGAAIDMLMNISASLLGDYGTHSRFLEQRVMGQVNRFFTIATGETPLITLMQSLAATLGQDEILRTAEKIAGGRVINGDLSARLAAAGLDSDMLSRIHAAATPHMREVNGLRFGMSDKWADQAAARAFESAVARDAHGVTLRPGVGDTPLFMSKEWGKFIMQFKSFAFAASRVVGTPLLQGIAHGDARAMEALVALVAMGTASYVTKQKAAGQPIEANPGRLAGEVLDKSNILGWTGELIFPALYLAGFKQLSRWSDRDPIETILGPSAGTVASAIWDRRVPTRIAQSMTGQLPGQEKMPFRRSDLHFLRKLMPANQVWYFRRAVNHMEDGIGDAFNLPGESLEARQEKDEHVAHGGAIQ